MIRAILALDDNNGLGKDNKLPWPSNLEDLNWFKNITENTTVVMGSNTWDSLPYKPLKNRHNIVVSNRRPFSKDVEIVRPDILKSRLSIIKGDIWIIGGAFLLESLTDCIQEYWISRISGCYECDTYFSKYLYKTVKYEEHNYYDKELYIEKWKKHAAIS